jgi:HK97 family phage major capsid protein
MTAIGQRERIRTEINAILASRGSLGPHRSERLQALLAEASSLDKSVAWETEQRQNAAFNAWLRSGSDAITAEQRSLLRPERRDMSEVGLGTGAATGAGVLVPTGFMAKAVAAMRAFDPIFDLAEIVNTATGRNLPWPQFNDTTSTGQLVAESIEFTLGDVGSFSQSVLGAWKYSSNLVRVSRELLNDSAVDVEALLSRAFGIRIARIAGQHLTTGTGSGQPNGIITAATSGGTAVGASSNDGSSAANTLGSDDVLSLKSAVDPIYWPNAVYMMNASTFISMSKQKDKEGRLLFPQLAHPDAEGPKLFGHRVHISPSLDSLQSVASSPQITRKPILFGDLSYYKVRLAPGVLLRLEERFGEFDEVAFVLIQRLDGNLLDGGGGAVKTLLTVY